VFPSFFSELEPNRRGGLADCHAARAVAHFPDRILRAAENMDVSAEFSRHTIAVNSIMVSVEMAGMPRSDT
jgi:hypothetical protein